MLKKILFLNWDWEGKTLFLVNDIVSKFLGKNLKEIDFGIFALDNTQAIRGAEAIAPYLSYPKKSVTVCKGDYEHRWNDFECVIVFVAGGFFTPKADLMIMFSKTASFEREQIAIVEGETLLDFIPSTPKLNPSKGFLINLEEGIITHS